MTGMGCKIGYSSASPVTYVGIDNLVDLTWPSMTADRVDKTVHSATSMLKRTEPGLKSVADVTFTLLMDLSDATQAALIALQEANTKVYWREEAPTNDAKTLFKGVDFQGRIADYKIAAPKEGEQTITFTIQFDDEDLYWDDLAGASLIT